MTRTTVLLAAVVLLGTACASQDLPYDAPQAGADGVAQVLGVERYEGYEGARNGDLEVVIWRIVRDDGRECDEIAYQWQQGGGPDQWLSLRHQRQSIFGIFASNHVSLPDAICLHADVLGVE